MNATTQAEVEVLEALPTPAQAVAILRDTALAELNAVDAGIAALRESYAGKTYAVTTTQGLDDAKKARAEEIALLEAMKQEAIRGNRIREAGPALLSAAQKALEECVDLIATPAGDALAAAVELATGEKP